jgi:hypothetical protein
MAAQHASWETSKHLKMALLVVMPGSAFGG